MGFLSELIDGYQDHLERRRQRPFLTASMAACALVATADGNVSFSEHVRVDQILQTLKQLQAFDPHEGIEIFRAFCDDILANPMDGHERTWQALESNLTTPGCRDLVVRICLAVSESNAETQLADQIEIVSICSRLGIDPSGVGLYVDTL